MAPSLFRPERTGGKQDVPVPEGAGAVQSAQASNHIFRDLAFHELSAVFRSAAIKTKNPARRSGRAQIASFNFPNALICIALSSIGPVWPRSGQAARWR
jgi:hypothetical protein